MKHFLVILGITALVWLGVSMSDEAEYPMTVDVQMTGYDTVRYAVVSADSSLDVSVRMSHARAFINSIHPRTPVLRVAVHEDDDAVAVSSLSEQLKHVVGGAKSVSSSVDSLHVVLAPRASRSYTPRIDDVEFSFREQYGLYGEPVVEPSEVTLYGPAEALAAIDELKLIASHIYGINKSGSYTLPIEPVWLQYSDVYPSCTEVQIYLPVEAYVEREFRVPVHVLDADTSVSYKLYPEEVTVRAWVAQRDISNTPDFEVVVDYSDIFLYDGHLTPRLSEFPSYVRPRLIEPQEIQCVVIQ